MRGSGDRANVPIKQADCALFHCGKNNLSHNRLQSDSTRCNSLIILIKMPPRCKPQPAIHFCCFGISMISWFPLKLACSAWWAKSFFMGFTFYLGFDSKPVRDWWDEALPDGGRWPAREAGLTVLTNLLKVKRDGWKQEWVEGSGAASPCQKGSWEHLLTQGKSVPGQPAGAGPPGRRWAAEGGWRCRGPPGLWLCAPESSRCTGRQCWSCGNGRRNGIKSDSKSSWS